MDIEDWQTLLFVPGHRNDRFEKAARSGAHAIIIDLEDAVPAIEKVQARSNLGAIPRSASVVVRINSAGTEWHADDVAAVAETRPDAVMLPKAYSTQGLSILQEKLGVGVPIIALMETAEGLENVRQLSRSGAICRWAFGSVDFAADLTCSHTPEALSAARQELVLASRLGGLPAPIDGVTLDVADDEALARDAEHAKALGFAGKLCVHPSQIPVVEAVFAPNNEEIAWARKVLAAGDGVSKVGSTMVDRPVRKRAADILARACHRQS